MSDSLITKKAIAQCLKNLTREKSFPKVSVGDITSACGLNRQTFYYHFQDKFELLDWIYYEECFVPILDGITFDNWDGRILMLLDTMKADKAFYGNVIKNAGEGFRNYLYSITSTLFEEAVDALDIHRQVGEEEKRFLGSFYAYGICGTVMGWAENGMKEPAQQLSARLKGVARVSERLAYRRYLEDSAWNPDVGASNPEDGASNPDDRSGVHMEERPN